VVSLTEWIAHLKRSELALKFDFETEVGACMASAAKKAKGFIGEQQPGWDNLAPSTIKAKAALGYPVPAPLLREGDLRDSINSEVETVGNEIIGLVYSDDPIAEYQEYGTSRIPPRPFIVPALIQTEPEIQTALGETLVRALTPGGRK
jgi:HK97 gp10 family phage protein